MIRRLVPLLAVLAAAPAALAAGPGPYATQGGPGVLSPDRSVRYVALGSKESTVIAAIATKDGSVLRTRSVPGSFGIPALASGSSYDGVSHDGRELVLQSTGFGARTSFLVLATRTLTVRERLVLPGIFAFDALSPDETRLYLVQHTSLDDLEHYVVRAYDLAAHRLLPNRIADRTQKSWVMQGYPTARTTSSSGRWVYTLYANPNGYPFIHALDTVRGVAHCIGLPWPETSDQAPLWTFTLALRGGSLAVQRPGGHVRWLVDRTSWRLSTPA